MRSRWCSIPSPAGPASSRATRSWAKRPCSSRSATPAATRPRATSASCAADSCPTGRGRVPRGRRSAALEHFLASNRLVPNRNVVFDIAETYAQLKDFPDAYRYYVQALEAETDPAERARIEKSLQKVAHTVAVLRVRTNPPGATLYID